MPLRYRRMVRYPARLSHRPLPPGAMICVHTNGASTPADGTLRSRVAAAGGGRTARRPRAGVRPRGGAPDPTAPGGLGLIERDIRRLTQPRELQGVRGELGHPRTE